MWVRGGAAGDVSKVCVKDVEGVGAYGGEESKEGGEYEVYCEVVDP